MIHGLEEKEAQFPTMGDIGSYQGVTNPIRSKMIPDTQL